jgi:superfamily II DNA/RNA helicase
MYIRVTIVTGGANMLTQQSEMIGSRPHIVVATPGRLLDLLRG